MFPGRLCESVREDNHHKEQCNLIPNERNHEKQGIHLTHRYKNFTYTNCHNIPANTKDNSLRSPSSSASSESALYLQPFARLSSPNLYQSKISCIYPKINSNICGKSSIYQKKTKDLEMHDFFAEIHDLDFIAKEFKYYRI